MNVAHHYDLSDKLYDLFLDPKKQYSCAYFKNENDNLETAQNNKIQQGLKIFKNEGININSFFAPNHTYDLNTFKALKENGLTITVEANVRNVNFLDLESGIFKAFMKPNDKPVYVHKKSNHPPAIT